VIPCLLLRGQGLFKTNRFRQPKYVGDPINAVKLFNDLEVDELLFLDIDATPNAREPNFEGLRAITDQCFMPVSYGGGLRSVEQARRLFRLGVEKVVLNTAGTERPRLIAELANAFGRQSVVVAVDVKKDWRGRKRVFGHCGTKNTGLDPLAWAQEAESRGAGEILINSIDRDGTMEGYDIPLIQSISAAVRVPVIACGGAGSLDDLAKAIRAGASAAAAGSLFVFRGRHRAVLINYPSQDELRTIMVQQ
jgi:cyclase